MLLYGAGIALGVRLPLDEWLQMTGLILVALVPIAILGILLGHLLTPDSMGPVLGGLSALLAFLGGPGSSPRASWRRSAQYVPSYWLTQAGRLTVAERVLAREGLAGRRRLVGGAGRARGLGLPAR